MDKFLQLLQPATNNLYLSALIAVIPIIYYLVALMIFKMKNWLAGLATLILVILIAIVAFDMPATFALMSAIQGMVYGILPIGWIILTSVFLYKMTVKTGHFDIIRDSISAITDDRRIQAILIAYAFGSFLEGAAGFGAPVAITAALLVGLGFKPLYAAGVCLFANAAPGAFGAVGAPIAAIDSLTTYGDGSPIQAFDIAATVGRQVFLTTSMTPLYLVIIMAGFKKAMEIWPVLLVAGGSYALTQILTTNYHGEQLPDITSALVSLVCTVLLLQVWQPKSIWRFKDEVEPTVEQTKHSMSSIIVAWSPFLVLTAIILIWIQPVMKAFFKSIAFHPAVPFIHNNIISSVLDKPIAAEFKLDLLGAVGTAILVAALISKFIIKLSWQDTAATFVETFNEVKLALLSICLIVGFSYVMNAAGMSNTLGSALAATGGLFKFLSPTLGWLGVFITGSVTSANLLFGKLQQVTALKVGMDPLIAIAAAAVGLVGREGDILKFTIKHSIILLIIICAIIALQATGILVG